MMLTIHPFLLRQSTEYMRLRKGDGGVVIVRTYIVSFEALLLKVLLQLLHLTLALHQSLVSQPKGFRGDGGQPISTQNQHACFKKEHTQ